MHFQIHMIKGSTIGTYLTQIWHKELYGPGKIYKIEFSLKEEEYFALKATI